MGRKYGNPTHTCPSPCAVEEAHTTGSRNTHQGWILCGTVMPPKRYRASAVYFRLLDPSHPLFGPQMSEYSEIYPGGTPYHAKQGDESLKLGRVFFVITGPFVVLNPA